MSKYESLDARTGLEQTIAVDLRDGLEKRGFQVTHSGTRDSHAIAGKPDIEVKNSTYLITFEVTTCKGAAQDREFQSIRDHLKEVKEHNQNKKCFCVFVSPITSTRTLDSIRDHNQQRVTENRADMRILPLSFENLELWITRLKQSVADLFPISDFLKLFEQHSEFIDDLRVRKLLTQLVFPGDSDLGESVKRQEIEQDEKTLESLIKDLDKIENFMRENGIATSQNAIDNLIYLVFMKLYDEKRERDSGQTNRLRSVENFLRWRQDSVDARKRADNRAIHELFFQLQQEGEFLESQMFTRNDRLVDSLDDTFVTERFIPTFGKYTFIGTKVDALGAVYEVLAQRAGKDVKVGQFFTPENVVRFMVRLAELDFRDVVLDPACGTGRFLIHAMLDMLEKVETSNIRVKENERDQVRLQRCFGTDIDLRIAKIAKMNMWIHGDGKSNIKDYNGLVLHSKTFNGRSSYDNAFDVVLTNPPLGALNYQIIPFTTGTDLPMSVSDRLRRIPILPRKNLTAEKLERKRSSLLKYEIELLELEKQLETSRDAKLVKRVETKTRSVVKAQREVADLEAEIRSERIDYQITGNTMKGGALFIAAIWHYLKGDAYPENPPEWRGGKMLIVLDEGILNTDDYAEVRDFLRSHFYIKAVISLTRDTFIPISKTSTKTSILYAIKKPDLHAIQSEPIFFAHVDRVGVDTTGKVCENDLGSILQEYFSFKSRVLSSYAGLEFRKDRFALNV